MQLKVNKEIDSTRKYWFILLFYILLILVIFIITGQARWSFFLIFSAFIALFYSLVFWQLFILPDIGLSKHLRLSKFIILNQLFNTPLVLSVKNGEIDGDFVLLKNKPNVQVLNIDQKSAVIIEDTPNQTSLLLHGIHIIKNNPKIIGTFYLGFRCVQFGPEDQNALNPKFIQESLAEYHTRITLAEKTKTRLSSGDFIYPSFTVFYKFASQSIDNDDLEMFLNILKLGKKINSAVYSSKHFESYLVNEILKSWWEYCSKKKREEILAEFPGSFEPKDTRIKRVKFRIYIDNIY